MSRVSAVLFVKNPFSPPPPPPPSPTEGVNFFGSKEQINFPQQSPKMLKMASESFMHALLLFFRSFSQNFPLGASGNLGDTVAYASLEACK